ncbi:hypothetical protein LXL04_036294 [Taraxacum kok-saghyz]
MPMLPAFAASPQTCTLIYPLRVLRNPNNHRIFHCLDLHSKKIIFTFVSMTPNTPFPQHLRTSKLYSIQIPPV